MKRFPPSAGPRRGFLSLADSEQFRPP